MRTIETTTTVEEDGTLVVKLPPDIEPGLRHVILMIDELPTTPVGASLPPLAIHASPWTGYPADYSFRREDMYGDDGR